MSTKAYSPRLADKYKKDVVPALVKKFGYGSVMQAPRLEKICLNRGVNGAVSDKKLVDIAVEELTTITGQRAIATNSKKDISNFKLRKNMPIGARVTLRGEKMYEFLDRLISVALPRVRDFKGINEKPFVSGTYSFHDSTFQMQDNGCMGATGTYTLQFFAKGDSFRIKLIDDPCEPRANGSNNRVFGKVK